MGMTYCVVEQISHSPTESFPITENACARDLGGVDSDRRCATQSSALVKYDLVEVDLCSDFGHAAFVIPGQDQQIIDDASDPLEISKRYSGCLGPIGGVAVSESYLEFSLGGGQCRSW
jgi:hypothetical protein